MSEHHAREQLKRIVIDAMVEYSRGGGMAVTAGDAADKIISLMDPSPEEIERRKRAFNDAFGGPERDMNIGWPPCSNKIVEARHIVNHISVVRDQLPKVARLDRLLRDIAQTAVPKGLTDMLNAYKALSVDYAIGLTEIRDAAWGPKDDTDPVPRIRRTANYWLTEGSEDSREAVSKARKARG